MTVVQQNTSVCQSIRDTQSTILEQVEQQSVVLQTVQNTIRGVAGQGQTFQGAVRSEFATMNIETAAKLDRALELLSQLSVGLHRSPEATEIGHEPESINGARSQKALPYQGVLEGINLVMDTVRDKQGIFLFEDVSDVTKALFSFLDALDHESSLDSGASFVSRYQNLYQGSPRARSCRLTKRYKGCSEYLDVFTRYCG
jgi:hypothetical protein